MSEKSVMKFLFEIQKLWNNSNNKEAKERAQLLSKILENETPNFNEWNSELKCDPPSINFEQLDIPTELNDEENQSMFNAFIEAFAHMPWKHPKQLSNSLQNILKGEDNFKSAMLVGTRALGAVLESNEMYIGLTYLSPGTTYPQHAHNATELYFTLLGRALWGPSLRHLAVVQPGSYIFHSSAQPHAFKVPDDSPPLLAVYCWTGEIPARFWFCNHDGEIAKKYSKDINKEMEDVEKYYDDMSNDYESVVRSWGYNMPESVVEALEFYGNLSKENAWSMLDIGCGDGLCGKILKNRGFSIDGLIGIDISSNMLQKAKERNCYSSLIWEDVLKPLQFHENSFDYIICVGTTTYLDPCVLNDWLRVLKPGGIICMTHKSQVWPKWEAVQQKLVEERKWNQLWQSDDLFYLPSCDGEDIKTRVKIYLFQK